MKRMTMMVLAAAAALVSGAQEAAKPAEAKPGSSYVWANAGPEKAEPLLQEAAAFLEKEGHFYLATAENGGARVRPIKYVMIVDNRLLFLTSTKKEMCAQLLKSPEVELAKTATDGSAYLRFKGKATLCADAAVKAKLLEREPAFGKKFGAEQALFLVEPECVGIFPMKGGTPKTKRFVE